MQYNSIGTIGVDSALVEEGDDFGFSGDWTWTQ